MCGGIERGGMESERGKEEGGCREGHFVWATGDSGERGAVAAWGSEGGPMRGLVSPIAGPPETGEASFCMEQSAF